MWLKINGYCYIDSDEEPAYTTAATIWAIFFVILLLLAASIFYLFFKNRKLLAAESADLQTLEKRVQERRSQLEEHQ